MPINTYDHSLSLSPHVQFVVIHREQGAQIVLANGCFDILHCEHILAYSFSCQIMLSIENLASIPHLG